MKSQKSSQGNRKGATKTETGSDAMLDRNLGNDKSDDANGPEFSSFSENEFTTKQLLYLEHVLELIAVGPLPRQSQMAKTLNIRPQTICAWNRQPAFRRAFRRALQSRVETGDLLADLANVRMAQQGSAKHYELNLRRRGLWDAPNDFDGGGGGPTVGAVTFVGLPRPPTPANAAKMLPPPGATWCVNPDGTRVGVREDDTPQRDSNPGDGKSGVR